MNKGNNGKEDMQMNASIKVLAAAGTLAALSGCVAVPVVDAGYYEPAPAVVHVPPPLVYGPRFYYGPPAYYGPSVRFGVYGGRGHYHGGRRWR